MGREAHYVEVGPFDAGNAYVAYPFLDAVCTCLIIWFEMLNVVIYFFVAEFFEADDGAV